MTLENSGSEAIPNGPWAIYLCHIRVIEPAHTKHNPSGYVIPGSHGIKVTHINGCQHKFEPTASFSGLAGFQSLMVDFDAENWNVARTDVMPNWYIAAEGLQARTITSTSGEDLSFVGPFDSPKKWKRIPSDKYDPYTPQKRYTINDINNLKKPGQLIIPSPQEILGLDESKKINLRTGDWSIVAGADLKKEASFLAGNVHVFFTITSRSERWQATYIFYLMLLFIHLKLQNFKKIINCFLSLVLNAHYLLQVNLVFKWII